jgi:hypothetical protein
MSIILSPPSKYTDYVKCLGIYFGHNKAECKKLNIEKQLLKSEKIMDSWKKRNITMIGKIMIVKSNRKE